MLVWIWPRVCVCSHRWWVLGLGGAGAWEEGWVGEEGEAEAEAWLWGEETTIESGPWEEEGYFWQDIHATVGHETGRQVALRAADLQQKIWPAQQDLKVCAASEAARHGQSERHRDRQIGARSLGR